MVEVRYFAAAADVAGLSSETIELPAGVALAELHAELVARHGEPMARLLRVAAFLTDDELTRDLAQKAGGQVDILPPFAGG